MQRLGWYLYILQSLKLKAPKIPVYEMYEIEIGPRRKNLALKTKPKPCTQKKPCSTNSGTSQVTGRL